MLARAFGNVTIRIAIVEPLWRGAKWRLAVGFHTEPIGCPDPEKYRVPTLSGVPSWTDR